uniref:THD domain-containing protein n=1 Tax=Denticeps clupeoides TaxID=299321 RepID=A0AAY4A026_9TELE
GTTEVPLSKAPSPHTAPRPPVMAAGCSLTKVDVLIDNSVLYCPALAQHRNNTKPIQWEPRFNNGFSLTANNTLLTVPLDGLYYVYFGISYRIPGNYCEQKGVDRIQDLHTQVFKFTASYPKDIVIIKSIDSMTCTILAQRFVYAGQLIQLLKNDKLKMIIHTPHEVVNWFKGGIYFGAFLS